MLGARGFGPGSLRFRPRLDVGPAVGGSCHRARRHARKLRVAALRPGATRRPPGRGALGPTRHDRPGWAHSPAGSRGDPSALAGRGPWRAHCSLQRRPTSVRSGPPPLRSEGSARSVRDGVHADDLGVLAGLVADNWRAGVDRDWSARAGTLDWSCTETADHAVDSALAPGVLPGAPQGRTAIRPAEPFTLGPDARPLDLVEAVETAARVLTGVVAARRSGGAGGHLAAARRSRRDRPRTSCPVARSSWPCTPTTWRLGLDLPFDATRRARASDSGRTRSSGRMWSSPGWTPLTMDGDPWLDLLRSSGRSADGE